MKSDYDAPYQVFHALNDNYRILYFTGLDKHVFVDGYNYIVEKYFEEIGDWDTMRGGSMFKSFELADNFIQKDIALRMEKREDEE